MIAIRGVSPTGTEFASGSRDELSELSDRFERDHCVRLAGFIDRKLCREIVAEIERADFYEREHNGIGMEGCMEPNSTLTTLVFLANDERLFETIRRITGCGKIGCFDGRVYRLSPASEHGDSWHSDMADNRMIAMSVNLSAGQFAGGTLQIRNQGSRETIYESGGSEPGDALIFRLAESLRHRVSPVRGEVPRTAFAGWFKSRPTFRSVLDGSGWSV